MKLVIGEGKSMRGYTAIPVNTRIKMALPLLPLLFNYRPLPSLLSPVTVVVVVRHYCLCRPSPLSLSSVSVVSVVIVCYCCFYRPSPLSLSFVGT